MQRQDLSTLKSLVCAKRSAQNQAGLRPHRKQQVYDAQIRQKAQSVLEYLIIRCRLKMRIVRPRALRMNQGAIVNAVGRDYIYIMIRHLVLRRDLE